MNKKMMLIALLTIVFAAPAIFAMELLEPTAPKKPDFTLSKLKYETIKGPNIDFINNRKSRIPGTTYIARFNLDSATDFGYRNTAWRTRDGEIRKDWYYIVGYGEKILNTPTGMKLSTKQKELVAKGYANVMLKTSSGISPIYALGVDKEQAQNTAIAYVECLAEEAEARYNRHKKKLSGHEKEHRERKKSIDSYLDKTKTAREKYEQVKQKTHYQDQDAALKAIERMNLIFETKIIEMRVLEAKLQTIEKSLAREKVNRKAYMKGWSDRKMNPPGDYDRQPLILKLEELRIDISISFAEVNATVKAADKIRTDAELFIKYQNDYNNVTRTHSNLQKANTTVYNKILTCKKEIDHCRPPKVIDNKVILQPITVPAVAIPEHPAWWLNSIKRYINLAACSALLG